jgi:signal transduction histidine kinase
VLRQELKLSAEQAQLMDIVLRESERLNDTISSFLAYARPRRHHGDVVDLGRVLRESATLLRHDTAGGHAHQILLSAPTTACLACVDEDQMRQIVWNLATNGLKAMPAGGRLELQLAQDGDRIVLTVRDEGVGIEAVELDRVFEPFRSTFAGGTGLGLSIVHRIVSDAGGEIDLQSTPGRGTTVRVIRPAASGLSELAAQSA